MLRTFTLSAIIKAKATSCCFHRLLFGIVRKLSDVATDSADSSGITIKQRRESLGEADQYFDHTGYVWAPIRTLNLTKWVKSCRRTERCSKPVFRGRMWVNT